MSSSRALTGGTRDVNPQWLSFSANQTSADTTRTVAQAIPVQRLPTGGRAQVIEVLKVIFEFPQWPAIASATETSDTIACYLCTFDASTTNVNLATTRVFAGINLLQRGAFTAAGTYAYIWDFSRSIDLTDGAGHGIIIATDNIFAQVQSAATGASNTVNIKVLYRWKNIGLPEYIGIVQSQQ